MIEELDLFEEWKPIEGFDDYEVSSCGRIYSKISKKCLKTVKSKVGYLSVSLYKNGIKKICLVHRLVAQAFLLNPENLPEVNHRDEDKTNNIVDNLEWCTSRYNSNYGTRNQRFIETKIKNGYCNPENVGLGRKEYQKKYYQSHKNELKEQNMKYYQSHKEEILEYQKQIYQSHKEQILEYQRQRYQSHKLKLTS